MTYIKLEDVQKILDKYTFYSGILRDEISSLPSINPESIIEEMIETRNDCNDDFQKGFDFALVTILQKFKS